MKKLNRFLLEILAEESITELSWWQTIGLIVGAIFTALLFYIFIVVCLLF